MIYTMKLKKKKQKTKKPTKPKTTGCPRENYSVLPHAWNIAITSQARSK